jgi:hypothetical protein
MATDLGQFLGGGGGTKKVHLTGSGTWTRPANTSLVRIIMVGGGSGQGASPQGLPTTPSWQGFAFGGGAGGWVSEYYGPVSQNLVYSCGAGGTSQNGAPSGFVEGSPTTIPTLNIEASGGGYQTGSGQGIVGIGPSVSFGTVSGGGAGAGGDGGNAGLIVPSASDTQWGLNNTQNGQLSTDQLLTPANPSVTGLQTPDINFSTAGYFANALGGIPQVRGGRPGYYGSDHYDPSQPGTNTAAAMAGGRGKYGLGGGGTGADIGYIPTQVVPLTRFWNTPWGGGGGVFRRGPAPTQAAGNNGVDGMGGGAGGSVFVYAPPNSASPRIASQIPGGQSRGGNGGIIIEYWES